MPSSAPIDESDIVALGADLEPGTLLAAYRRKYWLTVPLFMGRYIRKGLTRKTSVLIRITPVPSAG